MTKVRAHVDQEDGAARGSLPALPSSLYKSQVSSDKPQATSGPEARPKRGWGIRALRQPQPPAKYIGFSRISQELFCRRTLESRIRSGARQSFKPQAARLNFLMFAITDIRNSFIPALAAAPAFIALSRCWAAVLFVCLHGRCPGPAFNRSLVDHMRGHTNN